MKLLLFATVKNIGRLAQGCEVWAEPRTWDPEVHVEDAGVGVTFYTYSGLGIERITRHIDTFVLRRYTLKTTIAVMAEGSRGYVF